MKRININDYHPSLGILIDVRDKIYFDKEHHPNSINIPYEKLLMNHAYYLNKNQKYFITCTKGHKSQKAVSILEYYGYDVTQVLSQ